MTEGCQRMASSICQVGKLMYDHGLVVAGDGNISARIAEDRILVTPSGVCKGRMSPDMIVLCDLDGNVDSGDATGRQPSSEIKMHLLVYRARPDVGAIVHAHPPAATARAVRRKPLDAAYLPELIVGLGNVPVCDFALPSTDAVPASIEPYIADHSAVLLANHGALAWGVDVWKAFDTLETVEHAARIFEKVEAAGDGVQLSAEDVSKLHELRSYYQQRARVQRQDF